MADFATWVEAAAPALGWPPTSFLTAYRDNQYEAIKSILDDNVIAIKIKELTEKARGRGRDK
jgi:hypothetical protein